MKRNFPPEPSTSCTKSRMPSSSRSVVFQQDGSRAISKQDAGGAILIIQNGSHHVAADDQRFFLSAGAHKLGADRQGIEKSGTGRRKIESPRVRGAQIVLNQAGGCGEHHVRRDAGNHDQVDLRRGHVFAGQELACGSGGQVRRADALLGDVAFADAGALPNPGIVGVHQLLQIGIGHHPGRHVPAHTGNLCSNASGHSVSVRLVGPRQEEPRFYAIKGGETSLVWLPRFRDAPVVGHASACRV